MTDKKEFDFNSDPVPNSTKELLFNPSATIAGKAGAGLMSFISIPFRAVGIWSENYIDNFEKKILEKNLQIPEENRDFSKFQQTIKAIDDAKYSLAEENLQEYFSNLISATLDNRKNNNIHPSFSSILKDFSPNDARIFKKIFDDERVPTIGINYINTSNHANYSVERNILLFEDEILIASKELNSLERSGLIEIDERNRLLAHKFAKRYANFEKSDLYKKYQNNIKVKPIETDAGELDKLDLATGYLSLTDIGREFGKAVLGNFITYEIG